MAPQWKITRFLMVCSGVGTAVGALVLGKEYVGGGTYEGKENLKGKFVIVTGANTGIGRETAKELSKREATVVMACRDLEKCSKARNEIMLETRKKNLICKECDLASIDSIHDFVKSVQKLTDKVDILINNAAVMRCPRTLTKDAFEMQFGVNHLGHFLLTNLLLENIQKASPSRIINVSSTAHARGFINFTDLNSEKDYNPAYAYNQSKLANLLFTIELTEKLKGTGVTCNAVNPGITNTEITRHMSMQNSFLALIFVRPFFWLFSKTPRQGAQTTVYAALNEDLKDVSGKYFSASKEVEPTISSESLAATKRLWAVSERWTRLS